MLKKIIHGFLILFLAALSLALTLGLVSGVLLGGVPDSSVQGVKAPNLAIMDRFDTYITNRISTALDGVLSIDKVYWLSDDDQVAPEPNQKLFGASSDPSKMAGFLADAEKLLDGQKTHFSTSTVLAPETEAKYYLDETIMAITWKEAIDNVMFTFSEIKIAHPSQFRRFLAGGFYGSGIQLLPTQMAESVNAVVASSGDFYAHRRQGVVVYDGKVQRVNSQEVDTCYIDDQGDLLFSYRGQLPDMESAQAFVDENNIRFSLAFGPVLLDKGEKKDFTGYYLGEAFKKYSRAALCQLGPLHYMLVVTNIEGDFDGELFTVSQIQDYLISFGVEHAYTLDGGQTAAIVMNDQLINRVTYGYQRDVSDIIYFATAIPDGE